MIGKRSAVCERIAERGDPDEFILVQCWTAGDIVDAVTAGDDETYLTEDQACAILLDLRWCVGVTEERMREAAVRLYGPIPEYTQVCSLCRERRPADAMHLHQGRWIGECCWDEQLQPSK